MIEEYKATRSRNQTVTQETVNLLNPQVHSVSHIELLILQTT